MTNTAKHLLAFSAALLASAGALTAAASPAHAKDVTVYADEEGESLSRAVSFADLNLASATGQKSLDGRVGRAVRYVCEPHRDRSARTRYGECVDFAWDGARPQMAQAVERAQQLAATGTTSIAPVAIAIRGIGQ
jgi:UrcA family protein